MFTAAIHVPWAILKLRKGVACGLVLLSASRFFS
jgi:hypothetical protein